MQLHQLRYVVAIAEETSFTRAAARLHVAQPSVSAAVRALEAELGTPLFDRARGAVSLTAAGEVLLPYARTVLADCEAARLGVRDLQGLRRGHLAVGATPSLVTNVLPPVLVRFHQLYPGVSLQLHEAGSGDLVALLGQGRLDLALVILPVPHAWVRTVTLFDEELVLAVPRTHPLAERERIRVADLDRLPLVMFRDGYDLREATLAACREAGVRPTLALEGGEMDGVLALAAAGLGAAVVPAGVVGEDARLRAVRFDAPGLRRTVGLATRADRTPSRATRVLAEALQAAGLAGDAVQAQRV